MNQLARYAKAAVAVIGAAASVLTALNVHATWVAAIVAAATALGVYAVPNRHAAIKVPARPKVTP